MFLSKLSNGVYHIYYTNSNGKKTKISTRTKLKGEANKFLADFHNEIKQKQENRLSPISLKKFSFEFLKYSEAIHSINHTKSIRTSFNEFIKYTGNIMLAEISKKLIVDFVELRLRMVSNYTIRRDLADLSSAFNWGISKDYILENPCKGIKKPKLIEKVPIFFSEAEFNTLISSINDKDLIDIIRFAALTGIRQNDLINLRWEQVNFKNRTLTLDNRFSQTKSRKVHVLPLNLKSLQILTGRQLTCKHNTHIFTYNDNPIKQSFISHKFKKLVKTAQLNPGFTFHSLRHSFGSWLVQKGVPLYQVSKLMTHSDLRVTQIYTHLSEQNLKDAVELLDD